MFYKSEELNNIARIGNKNIQIMQEKTDNIYKHIEKLYLLNRLTNIALMIVTIAYIIHLLK